MSEQINEKCLWKVVYDAGGAAEAWVVADSMEDVMKYMVATRHYHPSFYHIELFHHKIEIPKGTVK